VQLLQEPSSLNLRCAHGLLFENDNAQLRADALALLSRIATVVDEQGGFVTQVVVMNADAPEDGEFGLSRRRAAAVAAELQQDGVPAARLRAQGRRLLDASGHAAVEWLFKPVVEEREAEAWTPPA
jgi:flagellar motor protein MotB